MPWEFFDRAASEVESNIGYMNQRADETMAVALAAVEQIQNVSFEGITGTPPQISLPEINIPPAVNPVAPQSRSFGTIPGGSATWEDLTVQGAPSLSDLLRDIPTFVSTIGNPNIPPAPDPIDTSGLPTKPPISEIIVPPAPEYVLPDLGAMIPINIPEFTFPELPTFTESAPTFTAAEPNGGLVWVEPDYSSASLDELQAEIHRVMQGGTGLPAAIQLALFEAARSREGITALAAQQEAFDTFAGRNFAMPPGALAKAVEAATEKSRLAANALEREILTKSAQWEIENLRFAVEKGIALETTLIGMFQAMATRTFEAARFRFESDLKIYESAITLFNARQNAYQVAAGVYKTLIEAQMSKVAMYRAQIEAEQVKGQVNEQTVKIYTAQLAALNQLVEIYKTKMQAAEVQSNFNKSIIEGYKVEVDAFGQLISARKTEFDAYDSQIKGEATKVGMYEAQARAFGETVRAYESEANIKLKWVDSELAMIRASTEKYQAMIARDRESAANALAVTQAAAQAFTAEVNRYKSEIDGVNDTRRVELSIAEARLRNLLAYYETQVREYDQGQERMMKRIQILEQAIESAGKIAASLATGAMSAIHVAANMHGNASVQDSQSYSVQINRQGADVA